MKRRRHGLVLLAILVVGAAGAILAVACAGASSTTEAQASPPSDGVTYLVKVTGAG